MQGFIKLNSVIDPDFKRGRALNGARALNEEIRYILTLDNNFAPYLVDTARWEKKTATTPLCGFKDDGEELKRELQKTAAQKCAQLELMLGQIANFATVISHNTITTLSTSLKDIRPSFVNTMAFR